eukprot:TRINITY_DN9062_c1_g1_i3.p1 TRINITY_DN9062_c1_g1~~TRINITY_DN9062_c1_g1_i3.p1  ORF type:complete len:166 (+),score=11.70 TRINITY_DN9062_c1_g1_i3:187-684(+)
MFFHITLTKNILMHPSSFGRRLHDEIRKALHKEVEGTVDPLYGFIVHVTGINDIPLGEVQDGGLVNFSVTYKAIIFRPFRNEVIDAVVSRIDTIGIHFRAGPVQGLIPRSDRSDMTYDQSVTAYSIPKYKLTEGDHIRLRVVYLTLHATELFDLGTIDADYLGMI